jgi:hypothetical protein
MLPKKVPHQPLKMLAYGEAGDIKLSKRDDRDIRKSLNQPLFNRRICHLW